jgi:hypothetical protein
MNFSKNPRNNYFETITLDSTVEDLSFKKPIYNTIDFLNILNLKEEFIFNYLKKYDNLLCILNYFKYLLHEIEINIIQDKLDFDKIFSSFSSKIIEVECIVNKDDNILDLINYIKFIIEFITFYKTNLVLDKYFSNLKFLLIQTVQLLISVFEIIIPIQEKEFIYPDKYVPIIHNILNKLLELKNITKFWLFIISLIPNNTKKIIIFDYENLNFLSSNYSNISKNGVNTIYNKASFINKLCSSINDSIENNSGIIIYNRISTIVERTEYLQEDGKGKFEEDFLNGQEILPHSSNCFNDHHGRIINNDEVTLIFIHKREDKDLNLNPLYLLKKYNYNVIKINLSAIISYEGYKFDMSIEDQRVEILGIINSNSLIKYLKEYDDAFCLLLLNTLKKNIDFSVFLLSTDKFEDIRGNLNDINDFFNNTRLNYLEYIYIKDINNIPVNLYIDYLLINNIGFDVRNFSRKVSDKKIYRRIDKVNIPYNYYTYYKKYLKYKQKYLKLSNK